MPAVAGRDWCRALVEEEVAQDGRGSPRPRRPLPVIKALLLAAWTRSSRARLDSSTFLKVFARA